MVIGFDIKMMVQISSIEAVFKSRGPLSHPFFIHNILSTIGALDSKHESWCCWDNPNILHTAQSFQLFLLIDVLNICLQRFCHVSEALTTLIYSCIFPKFTIKAGCQLVLGIRYRIQYEVKLRRLDFSALYQARIYARLLLLP